jgi:preprotein translocase subunit SecE
MVSQNKKPSIDKNDVQTKKTHVEEQNTSSFNLKDFVLWGLVVFLLLLAIVGNLLVNQYYEDVFASNNLYVMLKGGLIVVLIVIALVIAMLTTLGKKYLSFGKESYIEVRKVVWPTGTEARTTTIMIGVITLIVSVMLSVFDFVFLSVIRFITSL